MSTLNIENQAKTQQENAFRMIQMETYSMSDLTRFRICLELCLRWLATALPIAVTYQTNPDEHQLNA